MMGKKDPTRNQSAAAVRVAVFGTTDAIGALCDRAQIARKQEIQPSWELLATCLDMLCQAWASNCTAVEALGAIDLDEMQNICARMNARSLAMKDILEKEAKGGS